MKKAHKLISAVLVSTMVLSMTACGSGEKTYKVGILQQLEHPALDQATQGFQDALTKLMGDSVTFDVQNAQGEQANCSSIATTFVSNNYDLILANATTALQASAAATSTIPVLGTSVTDYATALDIDDWTGATGKKYFRYLRSGSVRPAGRYARGAVSRRQECRHPLLFRRTKLRVPGNRIRKVSG